MQRSGAGAGWVSRQPGLGLDPGGLDLNPRLEWMNGKPLRFTSKMGGKLIWWLDVLVKVLHF